MDEVGNRYWIDDRRLLHREDGPAVECVDGCKEWYVRGVRHRSGGPAVEGGEEMFWYKHGSYSKLTIVGR